MAWPANGHAISPELTKQGENINRQSPCNMYEACLHTPGPRINQPAQLRKKKICTALDLDESKRLETTKSDPTASIGPHLLLPALSRLISSRAKLGSVKVNDTNAWASDVEF